MLLYMENGSENIKILCIGVGGAGTNVINRMKDIGVPNAEFLTFGGYRYDYKHPEIPHYNLIKANETTTCQMVLVQKSLKSWLIMLQMI